MFRALNSNYKNRLFEIAASYFGVIQPEYFHFEYGPAHAKVFLCICSFQRKTTSHEGRTKIEAEQNASQEMLQIFETHLVAHAYNIKELKNNEVSIAPEMFTIIQTLSADPQFEVLSLYGDAVLRYHVARYLFDKYPQFQEGVLTRITSEALRGETRAEIAQQLGMEICVRTEVTSRTLAQAFSAVIGKCAISQGDGLCGNFIKEHYRAFIDLSVARILTSQMLGDDLMPSSYIETKIHNYKNELFEYAQKRALQPPTYFPIEQTGEAHAPVFTVRCCFQEEESLGQGKTIKSAEQEATQQMLTRLKRIDAASTRRVTESSYGNASLSHVKRFKAPALSALKVNIGWGHFNNLEDLHAAFTHPSKNQYINYQRLEFLGDALTKKMLFSYLLTHYPMLCDKGLVSSRMDYLVSEDTQANVAEKLSIGQHIFTDASLSASILSDVLEALTAAIFLDAEKNKINRSEMYMVAWFKPEIEKMWGKPIKFSAAGMAAPVSFVSNPQRFLNTKTVSRKVVDTHKLAGKATHK